MALRWATQEAIVAVCYAILSVAAGLIAGRYETGDYGTPVRFEIDYAGVDRTVPDFVPARWGYLQPSPNAL